MSPGSGPKGKKVGGNGERIGESSRLWRGGLGSRKDCGMMVALAARSLAHCLVSIVTRECDGSSRKVSKDDRSGK